MNQDRLENHNKLNYLNKTNDAADHSHASIYEQAVSKRGSSSSEEELLNSSDELKDIDKRIDALIVECRQIADSRRRSTEYHTDQEIAVAEFEEQQPMPSTSRRDRAASVPVQQSPEEKVQSMIRQAEVAKAQIFNTTGNKLNQFANVLSPSALVDEGYFVVGVHLDENMINKIGRGEYVDFS